MREYTEVDEVVKHKKEIRRLCDWCKQEFDEIERDDNGPGYRYSNLSLYIEWGYRCPPDWGEDYTEGYRVEDLCRECLEKLLALLKDAGIRVIGSPCI